MTERPNLIERLRQADLELKREQLSPAADRRLRQLMERGEPEPSPSSAWPRLVWVAVSAAVVLLAVWGIWGSWMRGRTLERPQLAGFQVAGGEAQIDAHDQVRCRSASCTLNAPDLATRLELKKETVMRRRERQIEIVRGEVICEVKPRPRKARPVKVFVSHGAIEVLGTRFTVRQGANGGEVTLHRGSIRFASADGRTVALRPGQSLVWPLPPATKAPTSQPTSQPAPPTPPTPPSQPAPKPRRQYFDEQGMVDLLEQLERLRSQQRYAKAVALLRRSLPKVRDRTTRERLSYELGSILTNQLRDSPRACRRWRRHLRVYGAKRYGVEIAKARKMLGCSLR